MNQMKMIVLLLVLVAFVNYVNYFQEDNAKLLKKIEHVQHRAEKEAAIKKHYESVNTDLNSSINYEKLMYKGKNLNYSQAMGSFQKEITAALKEECSSQNIQWSHNAKTEQWYERLAMSVKFECRPSHFVRFINTLRENHKLVNVERFKAYRHRKKRTVVFDINLVAYRMKANDAK